jgi:LmbE family N-acetylglucosaminyl deacetylase
VLVVSPHLDDSPLSALALMRRAAEVADDVESITVFTAPRTDGAPSSWDTYLGFSSSDEAMQARYDEDRRAMEIVGVRTRHLHLREELYREVGETPAVVAEMQQRLRDIVAESDAPTVIAIPAGLGADPSWFRLQRHKLSIPLLRVKPGGPSHTDHVLLRTHLLDLALELAPRVVVYEDLPYAWGGGYQDLIADLTAGGRSATRESIPVDLVLKERALRQYSSQFAMFFPKWSDRVADVFETVEHYWFVTRGPTRGRTGADPTRSDG